MHVSLCTEEKTFYMNLITTYCTVPEKKQTLKISTVVRHIRRTCKLSTAAAFVKEKS